MNTTANKKILTSLWGQVLIAACLGAIQVFAFAPFGQWWILYPSFIGMFLLLKYVQQHGQKLFLVSFIFNLAMFVSTLHWIYVSMDLFGGMPLIASAFLIVLLCAYLALFPSFALWISYKIPTCFATIRLLLILPSTWLIADWLRGWVLTGFPWAYLGYSHADTPLVGFAPILGVQGITLAILLICGSLTLLISKKSMLLASSLILLLIISGYGLKRLSFTTLQNPISVKLVQGNIDQNKKWLTAHLPTSLFKYLQLSGIKITPSILDTLLLAGKSKNPSVIADLKASGLSLDDTNYRDRINSEKELIIWPESAIAALEITMQAYLQVLSPILEANNKSLLTGIINYNVVDKSYLNSIIMLGKLPAGLGYSETSPNRYAKHQLLPIGEFVPFEALLRPLAPYFNLPMSSFKRGGEIQDNLRISDATMAPALCYEIAFPELLRKNVHDDTGIILTLSNDAWFGDSIGPHQHLEIARMRAIEFAKPLLRSTNNGITAIYDDKGKEVGRLPRNVEAVLKKKIQPAYGQTPYQRYGQVPLFIFCLLSLMSAFILKYKQSRSTKENL